MRKSQHFLNILKKIKMKAMRQKSNQMKQIHFVSFPKSMITRSALINGMIEDFQR